MKIRHYGIRAILGLGLIAGIISGCGKSIKKIETDAQPSALALDSRGRYLFIYCQGGQTLINWDIKKKKRVASIKVNAGEARLYINRDKEQLVLLNVLQKKAVTMTWPNLEIIEEKELGQKPLAWYEDSATSMQYYTFAEKNIIQPYLENNTMPIVQIGLGPEDILRQTDSDYLWSANYKANEVAVVNLRSNLVVKRIHVWANPYRLGMIPGRDKLYVLCIGKEAVPEKSVIQTVDLNYQTAGLTWNVGQQARAMEMDPRGRFIFTLSDQGLSIISIDTGAILQTITTPNVPDALAVSPDGTKVYIACKNDHAVYIYKIERAKLLAQ